jgi:hypothetical protein
VGLAYALAGKTERAIGLLEAAARAPGADGRVRQNLALAYALSGDWAKARTTAAQDVSPAELNDRLQKWAAMANPSASADKVAALLGTRAVSDAGQPVRLALADPAPRHYAAADPAPEPAPAAVAALAPETRQPEPVAVALATSGPAPVVTLAGPPAPPAPVDAVQPREQTRPVYADAVQSLVTMPPAVHSAAPARLKLASIPHFDIPAVRHNAVEHRTPSYAGPGKFAVQLGAFASSAAVERAWAQAYKRYGFAGTTPLSTTVAMPGRGTFHRLSVAGFASRGAADRICAAVRGHGGACFVRAVAGDAPVKWASRYTGTRHG